MISLYPIAPLTSPTPSLQEPPPSLPTSAPSLQDPPPFLPTSAPSLKELNNLPVTRWYFLGLQLGVDEHALEVIEKNYPQDIEMCKLKMFQTWLNTDPSATYKKLNQGLAAIGEPTLQGQWNITELKSNEEVMNH